MAARALLRVLSPSLLLLVAVSGCGDEGEGSSGAGATSTSGEATGSAGTGSTSAGTGEGSTISGSASSGATSGSTSGETSGSGSGSTTGEGTSTTGEGTSTTGGALEDCPRLRVLVPDGQVLNVRPDPSTQSPPVATLAKGAIVDVVAKVKGEALEGNDAWFEIAAPMGFVWSGLVECTTDEPPPPTGFWLPLECGMSAKITQGNFGNFSHQGTSAYAFDFSLGVGTPLVAIADGEVIYVYDKTKPGDPCYNGGDASCIDKANLVTLLHGDGTTSLYAHLSAVKVTVGATVPRGPAVGLSGSSGYSTGRHAHVARQETCKWGTCQSIAVSFEDVPGDGVPKTGDTVTSMNCP